MDENYNSNIYFLDKEGNWISRLSTIYVTQRTFSTPANCYYIQIHCGQILDGSTIQLEVGSTATAYHAYNGQTHNVPFGRTVYGGELVLHEGQNDKIINGYIISEMGNRGWNKVQAQGYTIFYSDFPLGSRAPTPQGLCEIYPTAANYTKDKVCVFYGSSQYNFSRIGIRDDSKAEMTVAQFQESVSGYKAVYEMRDPTETVLPTKTEIKTLLGANNIYHDCNGDIDVTYRANGALYVQEHPIT